MTMKRENKYSIIIFIEISWNKALILYKNLLPFEIHFVVEPYTRLNNIKFRVRRQLCASTYISITPSAIDEKQNPSRADDNPVMTPCHKACLMTMHQGAQGPCTQYTTNNCQHSVALTINLGAVHDVALDDGFILSTCHPRRQKMTLSSKVAIENVEMRQKVNISKHLVQSTRTLICYVWKFVWNLLCMKVWNTFIFLIKS